MQTDYSYARMEEKDLKEVVSIEQGVFRHPWSEEFFRLILKDHNNWVVTLRKKTTLLGYGGYHLLKKQPSFLPVTASLDGIIHLINIAISPSFQHKGLGTLLIEHLFNNAKRRNAGYCYLEVRPSNAKAIRFYQRSGFFVIGLIENYYAQEKEDAIVMGKRLPALIR
ncbi:MAG: ribosomal protein S18-alanine N-acetyltransferase [Spirochaetes bacterium]|nr:ribosomal protein S18-alanine N-acetyltransferase [Spirochaetota bacterium]